MSTAIYKASRADVHRDIEGVETKLLTEFWKWGRASEQKMQRV